MEKSEVSAETRRATAARSEQRALVRDVADMLSGTESVKGTRAPAAAVEIQSPVGWGRARVLGAAVCRARCGLWVCRSVRVRSKMGVHAPATWRRRLHKQTGGVRAGPGGAA